MRTRDLVVRSEGGGIDSMRTSDLVVPAGDDGIVSEEGEDVCPQEAQGHGDGQVHLRGGGRTSGHQEIR